MNTDFTIVTAKFYEQTFQISEPTAQRWYKDDCEMLGRKRLTLRQFNFIYAGVEPMKMPDVYVPKRCQKPTKKQKITN